MPLIDADLHARVTTAWSHQFLNTSVSARALAQRQAQLHGVALVGHFYTSMLDDAGTSTFLSHQMVEERLAASLRQWLNEVLAGGDKHAIESLFLRQLQVGAVHARIGIPAHLVVAGARMIKQALARYIHQTDNLTADVSEATLFQAMEYASIVIDLAIEVMIAAYSEARENSVKQDEAFRYFAGARNIGLERERQQGGLLEWENHVVFQLATGAPAANLPLLSAAHFGLWFKHKGQPVFGKDPQCATVNELIRECDKAIQELQDGILEDSAETRTTLLRQVHTTVAQIRQLTQSMFEKMMELESGRDELTHLLNRRFLSTVLRREVALSGRGKRSFAVIMVDVDHFKAINDRHGHASGDLALQTVAGILLRNLRISDYAFRYGGEEFLLVIVETDEKAALHAAERIRSQIEQETINLPGGHAMRLTVSMGVALHSGHPDYAHVINAADEALYRAKALGRNRVEIATRT